MFMSDASPGDLEILILMHARTDINFFFLAIHFDICSDIDVNPELWKSTMRREAVVGSASSVPLGKLSQGEFSPQTSTLS